MSLPTDTLPIPRRKIWRFRPIDEAQAESLGRSYGLSPFVARLLASRHLDSPEAVADFLKPSLATLHDPLGLRDMAPAVERLAQAINDGETIAVYGDYDVDGLTGTALLVRFLHWLKADVVPYIPHRLNDGYGMSRKGVEFLRDREAKLIVTVDNGICCPDEVAYAKKLGIDVIVTDHHEPCETLPDAVAVVDPKRADCDYPFSDLSGCGVAFKLAHALAKHLDLPPERAKPFLASLLDLVALGTIADVMPLLGENRALARFGLEELGRTTKPGLKAMAEMLGADGKKTTSETVAFLYGPRLNAAGRTGNATDALELLLTDSESRAWELAKFLDGLNQHRRILEAEVLAEALEMIEEQPSLLDAPVLVIAGDAWHQGVVGIVASRLVDRFGLPSIVIGIDDDAAKGSARSVEGFDILAALTECSDLLDGFGGHKAAAGVSLATDKIDAMRDRMRERVAQTAEGEALEPRLDLDMAASPDELTFEMMGQLDRLRPFGQGNHNPVIALTNCRLAAAPMTVAGKHLKLRLALDAPKDGANSLTAMWFNYPEPRPDVSAWIATAPAIDIAGSPRLNTWNGVESVEFTIKDIRPSE